MTRLLAMRGGALGDFLLTLPALSAVQAHWPQAHLTLATRPSYGELMLATGRVHAAADLNAAVLAELFSTGSAPSEKLRQFLAPFQHIIAWMKDDDGQFAENLRNACKADILVLDPVLRGEGNHAWKQLAKGLPFPVPEIPPPLRIGETAPAHVLAVHPGAGAPQKCWTAANFSHVIFSLARQFPNFSLLLIMGEADETSAGNVLHELRAASFPITLAHNWPLSRLASALSNCRAYLGHDTGVSHLAAACAVPSVWLFGPTNPDIWAPCLSHVHTLRAPQGELVNLPPSWVVDALTLRLLKGDGA